MIDRASELRVAFLVGTRDLGFFASDDFGFASETTRKGQITLCGRFYKLHYTKPHTALYA